MNRRVIFRNRVVDAIHRFHQEYKKSGAQHSPAPNLLKNFVRRLCALFKTWVNLHSEYLLQFFPQLFPTQVAGDDLAITVDEQGLWDGSD